MFRKRKNEQLEYLQEQYRCLTHYENKCKKYKHKNNKLYNIKKLLVLDILIEENKGKQNDSIRTRI